MKASPTVPRWKIIWLVLLTWTALGSAGFAQDANYWSLQYGTRAELLTGATTGALLGLSNTYYNPGALNLIKDPTLVLSTFAYALETIEVTNLLEPRAELATNRLFTVPSFFAGSLTFDPTRKHYFAYSILTRQRMDLTLDGKFIKPYLNPDGAPAANLFAGEGFFRQDLSETWAGLSWSYQPSSRIGFGITNYVAVRSQFTRRQYIAQSVSQTGEGTAAIGINELSYGHWRLLWKLGLAVDLAPWTLGLVVTTPSVELFGSGSKFVNFSFIGVDPDSLLSDYQDDLPAHYRSSWAVAAGASYKMNRTTLYGNVEWFNAVGNFTVIAGEDFQAQTTGEVFSNSAVQELKSVINFGLGVEHRFTEKFSLFGSFATDFSAAPAASSTTHSNWELYPYIGSSDITITNWDIYHITVGSQFTFMGLELTLGVERAFASSPIDQFVRFRPDIPQSPVGEPRDEAKVDYGKWELMLGFAYGFGSQQTRGIEPGQGQHQP